MKRQPLRLLERKHAAVILRFLLTSKDPVITKTIMEAIEVRNWSTITRTLAELEEAKLLTRTETRVGKYGSKAHLWQLNPAYGVRVASALEDVDRNLREAATL